MKPTTKHRTLESLDACMMCDLIARKVPRQQSMTPGQATHWERNRDLIRQKIDADAVHYGMQPRLSVQQEMFGG